MNRLLINKATLAAKLLIVSIYLGSSPTALACDSCASAAINSGFSSLIASANTLSTAIQGVNTQVTTLNTQIQTSTTTITTAIGTFSTSLEASMRLANERVIKSLSGLYVQLDNQFTILGQTEKNNTLELQNGILTAFKSAEKILRTHADMYEAGGELANFEGGKKADALIHLYQSNTNFSEKIFAMEADFLRRWNRRDPNLFVNNRAGYFDQMKQEVLGEIDKLIARKNVSSLISADDFQKLVYYAAFGLNPNRVKANSTDYPETIVKQANLLRDLVSKAPIIPLSDANKAFFGEFVPRHVDSSGCIQNYVDKGMIPGAVSCTSLDSIIAALVARPGTPSYIVSSTIASKRALAEEQLRSTMVGNIIMKRLLDAKRAENILESL